MTTKAKKQEDTYVSTEDFAKTVTQVGEFRARHNNYFICIDGVMYTWGDLGGDQRFTEWMYAKWVLYAGNREGFATFDEYVSTTLVGGQVFIQTYIKDNYPVTEVEDAEELYSNIANKCAKTISYGGTWVQIERYISKQIKYQIEESYYSRHSRRTRRRETDSDYY